MPPSQLPGTRLRLLEAATVEFADQGYAKATVRGICGRARANINAVKYYFEDKQGLYWAALEHAHRETMQHGPPPDLSGLAASRLRQFVQTMVRSMLSSRQSDAHHRLLLREMAEPTHATAEIVRRFVKPRFELLNEILAELLPRGTPERRRHLLAFSVVGQCLHYKVAMPVVEQLVPPGEASQYTADVLADHIAEVILKFCSHDSDNSDVNHSSDTDTQHSSDTR